MSGATFALVLTIMFTMGEYLDTDTVCLGDGVARGAGLASVGEIEGVRPRNLQLDSKDMSNVIEVSGQCRRES